MEEGQVIRSAGVVGGYTMLSRALGLIRDILMAGFFGTTLPMSAFVVAFTVPNLFRRLFGEGALSAAFVPVFIETREKEGEAEAWSVARNILSMLTLFLSVIIVLGIVFITLYLLRPGIGEKAAMTLPLLRIMLPYTLFICLAAMCMAILNSYHHFATPAFAPSLLNIVWILAVLLVCPFLGDQPEQQIFGVAWAVLVAGMLQFGVQLPKMTSYGYRPGWSLQFRDRRVRRVFRLMGPASLGMAITQINVLIDRLMAVWIGPWAPAALFFSERLIYFPQGIFATALSTVLLPVFSGHAARADHDRILRTINQSLRNLFYVMIPASIGLLVLARPIVQMIFEWREFGETSTDFTALALMFYAPGLLVFSLSKVFVPAFYALQDTRTPVKVALFTVCLKIALSLLFILTWPLHLKHAGLALATVLAEAVNGVVLAWLLHRRLGAPGWGAVAASVLRCLGASLVMAVCAVYAQRHILNALLGMEAVPEKAAQIVAVLAAIVVGMGVYVAATVLMRSPEIRAILQAVRKRFAPRAQG